MTKLEAHIRDIIAANGPMPIDQFMQIVIEYYYKNRQPFGKNGDFITAPEISQMFGEIIGIWCASKWIERGRNNFTLVEVGGGNGTLMSDLLRGTKHIAGFHASIEEVVMVEISENLKAKQKEAIKFQDIRWVSSLEELEKNNCIVICNELFDALPVKQFRASNGTSFEIHIDIVENTLQFIEIKSNIKFDPALNGIIEISPVSIQYAQRIEEKISNNGAALIIDYGYTTPTLKSTLQALRAHNHAHILSNIGEADVTALVDFTTLSKQFNNYELYTQRDFLFKYGIKERADSLKSKNPELIESQLNRLTSISEMGELFKVLEV